MEHREETGVIMQSMPLQSTINLVYSGKTMWLVPRASESTTPGATSKSFNRKVFINPDTLVNHRFGRSTPDSMAIQEINRYETFRIQFICMQDGASTPL